MNIINILLFYINIVNIIYYGFDLLYIAYIHAILK